MNIRMKQMYKLLAWLTKEKPFLLHIPACTWAQSTRQRSGCSINMGGLSSLCRRQKRPQKALRKFVKNKNWHEPKLPNSPGAAAQGIDRQPQFCSAEHVNLIARESKLKFSWNCKLLSLAILTFFLARASLYCNSEKKKKVNCEI